MPNNIPPSKECLICKVRFFKKINVSKKKWKKNSFCSRKCANKGLLGKPVWNQGIKIDRRKYPNYGHFQKHSKEALLKISLVAKREAIKRGSSFYSRMQELAIESAKQSGFKNFKGTLGKEKELSAVWQGDNASYNAKHRWIQKHWQKTGICQKCFKEVKPYGRRKWGTEWHNLDGKYDREKIETWIEVCKSCHNKLDN